MKVPNGPTPSGRLELTKQTPDPNLAIPGADANVIEAYVNDGSFNFRALSGVYQATFIPDSVDGIGKPSQTYRDIEITEENANLEFGYPSDAEFSLLEGRIAPANASLSDFENGTIRFSMPSTEIAPPQSSLGSIDAEGQFRIYAPANPSQQWSVEIRAERFSQNNTVRTVILYQTTVVNSEDTGSPMLIPLALPATQPARFRTVDSLSDTNLDVRYKLMANYSEGGDTIVHRIIGSPENPADWFQSALFPAVYSVEIVPEDDSPYLEQSFEQCVSLEEVDTACLTPDQSDALFALARGYTFQGIVKNAQGRALPNVPVIIRDQTGDRVAEAVSDSRGQFSATLNMGQTIKKAFSFEFRPDTSTEIPWHRATQDVDISNEVTGVFALPRGFAMSGLVIDKQLRPQTNIFLRFFDPETLNLLAIASPGSGGYFTVILANDTDGDPAK